MKPPKNAQRTGDKGRLRNIMAMGDTHHDKDACFRCKGCGAHFYTEKLATQCICNEFKSVEGTPRYEKQMTDDQGNNGLTN